MDGRDENYLVDVGGGFTDGEAAQLEAAGLRPLVGREGTGGDQIRLRADTYEEARERVVSILGERSYKWWAAVE